jgi:hypothetical protein
MRLFVALLAVLVLPAGAAAQGTGMTSTLSWTRLPGAEPCPTVVEIAAGVEAILGRSVLVGAASAERIVEASVERTESGFVAQIRFASGDGTLLGERALPSTDPSCADLAESASLVIALMIDPDAEAPIESAGERAGEAAAPDPGPTARVTIDLGGAATVGLGPFVSGAGYLRALMTIQGFVPVGLVGLLQPLSRAERTGGPWDFTEIFAGLTICPLFFHDSSISFGACAGIDVGGAVLVSAPATPGPAERERLLVQLDVQAYFRIAAVGPFGLHALAAFLVPFRTEPWRELGGAVAWAPEPIGGLFGLGLTFDFVTSGDGGRALSVP